VIVLLEQLLNALALAGLLFLVSAGLSLVFGILRVVNFAHGVFYMLGAYLGFTTVAVTGWFWPALVIVPPVVGVVGALLEASTLRFIYRRLPIYQLLLTFGIALILQGLFSNWFGSSGMPYEMPRQLQGGRVLPFMFLPNYRIWVIGVSLVVCFGTWAVTERTRIGSWLRAATENAALVSAFGINVPRMITVTYALGVALAALAGVLAAPIYRVSPLMGADLIIVVFAVVVIGGMGSILGSIVTGFTVGILEGLTKVFYPEASNTVIFVVMAIVLLVRPAGLFGKQA